MAGKERLRTKRNVELTQEVAQSVSTPSTLNDSNNPAAVGSTRLTPYERMRQLLAAKNGNTGLVVSAVEDLQAILKNNPQQRDTITIRMKLLWVSDHQHRQLRFARLHFIDADSPEPLDELLKVFRDPYQENAQTIDAILFTATVWNVDAGDNSLPPAGAVVDITSFSNLGLFRDVQCQATARLANLTWS